MKEQPVMGGAFPRNRYCKNDSDIQRYCWAFLGTEYSLS